MKRVFLIVLDSLGIGAAPDADKFGDVGTNTLLSCKKSTKLYIPTLEKLGLSRIDGIDFLEKADTPLASYARLRELGAGKDTTAGHWELMGLLSEHGMPTYEHGFPDEVIRDFEKRCGRGVLCNKPYSGTEVIRDYGEEHMKSGKLIVYTSADSVFQIAAHEDVVPLAELYKYCEIAREMLVGDIAVGRVIARPFVGEPGAFTRTGNRRDYSLEPHGETLLDAMKAQGFDVISVGKIRDIFAGRGITDTVVSHSNDEGMAASSALLSRDFRGLAFINLVDFDSAYGHRQDASGYAEALSRFDAWLQSFTDGLSEEDMLIITADHGCDPSDDSTDHTREYVPLLIYRRGAPSIDLGTLSGFGSVAGLIKNVLGVSFTPEACQDISI